jgi:hypothetical protein
MHTRMRAERIHSAIGADSYSREQQLSTLPNPMRTSTMPASAIVYP